MATNYSAALKNPAFMLVDVGSIMRRFLWAMSAYPVAKDLRLVGINTPGKSVGQALRSSILVNDRAYFVFRSASNSLPSSQTFDTYTRVLDLSGTPYFVLGVRQPELLQPSDATLTHLLSVFGAMVENYRVWRLDYYASYNVGNARTIAEVRSRLLDTAVRTCLTSVPYPLWVYVRSVLSSFPNVIEPTLISNFSATYHTLYSQRELAAIGKLSLNKMVLKRFAGSKNHGVTSMVARSALLADYDEVSTVENLYSDDCDRLQTAAWPLLLSPTRDEFIAKRNNLLQSFSLKF